MQQQAPLSRDAVSNSYFVYSQNTQMIPPPVLQKHPVQRIQQNPHEGARRGLVFNQEPRSQDRLQLSTHHNAGQHMQGNRPHPQMHQLPGQRILNDGPMFKTVELQSYSQNNSNPQSVFHAIPHNAQQSNFKAQLQRYPAVPHNSHATPPQVTPPQQSMMNPSQQQPSRVSQRDLQVGVQQPQSAQPQQQFMYSAGNDRNGSQRQARLANSVKMAYKQQPGSFQDPNRLLMQPLYDEDRMAQNYVSREREDDDEEDAQLNNLMYCQQKLQELFQRLVWIAQRFESLSGEFNIMTEYMRSMETEEQWSNFQTRYEQFCDRMVDMNDQVKQMLQENYEIMNGQNGQNGITDKEWQKRYGQLLGNFQTLQNQLSQTNFNIQERESRLHTVTYNLNRINQAYDALLNQRRENEEHQSGQRLYDLTAENEQLHLRISQLTHDLEIMHANKDNSKVEVEEYQKLAKIIAIKEKQISDMHRELNAKVLNGSGHDLRNDLSSMSDGPNQRKSTIEQINENLRKTEEKYIIQINGLKDQVNERDEALGLKQSQFQTMKAHNRDLQTYAQQLQKKVQSLNKELYQCNMHIDEVQNAMKLQQSEAFSLRGVSAELERMREEKQKDREYARKKQGEVEELKRREVVLVGKIGDMEDRLREQSSKKNETLLKNYASQIEGLKQNLRGREAEVIKMKGVLRVKEDYSESLLTEIKKLKDIAAMEISNRESAMRMPVARNYEYENKLKDVDNEFNSHLRRSLEEQILTLRKQCATKQEKIKSLEDNQVQLLARMPAFERQKVVHDREMLLITTKLQEAQQTKNALILKNEIAVEDKKKIEKELQESKNSELRLRNQINQQYTKNDESQTLIQAKQKIITQLQAQANSLIEKTKEAEEKARQLSFELIQQKKLENANISQSESKSLIPTVKEINHLPFLELEKENADLKQKIVELCEGFGNIEAPVQPPSTHEVQVQKTSPPELNIAKRLIAFNSRLSKMMNNEALAPSAWDEERKALVDQYEATIGSLNLRIHELQGGKGRKDGGQSPAKQDKDEESNHKISPNEEFYKIKMNQLGERNEQLLKINEQIKQKLQSLMKVKTNSTAQYYREHYQKASTEVEQLREKLRKMAHENKNYKMEAQTKWSKIAVVYEGKIFELQGQMQALNRKIAYLEIGKSKTENEKAQASYGHDTYYPSQIRSNRNLDLNFDLAEIMGTRYAA